MELRNSLKVWRAKAEITQERLANEIGVSRQTINSIEKRKFVPSVQTALKIAAFFDTAVEQIFSLKGEE